MKRLTWILWPSFIVAGIAEVLFFTLIDPQQLYLFGEPVHWSRMTIYSLGFFGFWAMCAGSSLLTCFIQRDSAQVNACLVAAACKDRVGPRN
jgi:H+/Cl- antiporter ClcA